MDAIHDSPEAPASARRAWTAILLVSLAWIVGLGLAYSVAGLMGTTLDPATGEGPSAAQRAVAFGAAGAVWMSVPLAAIVLAVAPVRAGSRSAIAAMAVGGVLVVAMGALTVANLVA